MEFKDLIIHSGGDVSSEFLKRNIINLSEALIFVRDLPYARNTDKENLITVFSDNCSTCGPKHALLKLLIDENEFAGFKLMLGVFKMNTENSPLVKETLENYNLTYIPEAHNYLRYHGKMIDVTKVVWNAAAIVRDLVQEIVIEANQISSFKVNYHKTFLQNWIKDNSIPYTLEQLWFIREQCIRDLSN